MTVTLSDETASALRLVVDHRIADVERWKREMPDHSARIADEYLTQLREIKVALARVA